MGTIPRFVIRVKLPSSAGYPSCPSGDTDFEVDRHEAITAATPPGFKVIPPRSGHQWALDSEGYTLILLESTDPGNALAMALARAEVAEEQLAVLRAKLSAL